MTTPQRPILDEYCWMHKSEGNGGWTCETCYHEQKAAFRETAQRELQTVPSYAGRFSFLRDCVRDGLLTEDEIETHEQNDIERREMNTGAIKAVLNERIAA